MSVNGGKEGGSGVQVVSDMSSLSWHRCWHYSCRHKVMCQAMCLITFIVTALTRCCHDQVWCSPFLMGRYVDN